MGSIETYQITQLVFTNTLIVFLIFCIFLLIWTSLRREKELKLKNKHLQERHANLLYELLELKAREPQAMMQARQAEHLFMVTKLVVQQEIINRYNISPEDALALKRLKAEMQEHLLQLEKEQCQQKFIDDYKTEALYVAVQAFCYEYNHYWVYPKAKVLLPDMTFRFSAARQALLLGTLFTLIDISLKYRQTVEILLELSEDSILFCFKTPVLKENINDFRAALTEIERFAKRGSLEFADDGVHMLLPIEEVTILAY